MIDLYFLAEWTPCKISSSTRSILLCITQDFAHGNMAIRLVETFDFQREIYDKPILQLTKQSLICLPYN